MKFPPLPRARLEAALRLARAVPARMPPKARLPSALAACVLAGAGAALACALWWPAAQNILGLTAAPRGAKLDYRAKFEDARALPAATGAKADFPVTPAGRKIIADALAYHAVPGIIPAERRSEALCAGFDFGLSEKIWGPAAPYYIGMMHPKTKRAADAWDLPMSYAWYGGEVLADVSPELRRKRADYLDEVGPERRADILAAAFSPRADLGDVGFLYRDSGYVAAMTGAYFNSHIGKILGVSEFRYAVPESFGTGAAAVAAAMGCRSDFFAKWSPALERYRMTLDGRPLEWRDGVPLRATERGWVPADIPARSTLGVRDVAVAHFFQGKSGVDGLFAMACGGQLLPANVTALNPRVAGK